MIHLTNTLPADTTTTEHTATLTGHGTDDVLTVTFAVARVPRQPAAAKVLRYTVTRAGRAPRDVSLATVYAYGLDVDHVRAAITAAVGA